MPKISKKHGHRESTFTTVALEYRQVDLGESRQGPDLDFSPDTGQYDRSSRVVVLDTPTLHLRDGPVKACAERNPSQAAWPNDLRNRVVKHPAEVDVFQVIGHRDALDWYIEARPETQSLQLAWERRHV